jgi:hypothetical protein
MLFAGPFVWREKVTDFEPAGRAPQLITLSGPIDQATFFLSEATNSNGFVVWNSLYVKAFLFGPQPIWPIDFSPVLVVVIVHSIPSAILGDAIEVFVR